MIQKNLARGLLIAAVAAFAAALPGAGFAQGDEIEPEAIELLRRATSYLAGMKQFRVDTTTTIEALLPSGQKLQFGHRVAVTVQRPNRLRAERVGELINQRFYYDGKSLTAVMPDLGYFATVPAPPTLDAALDFARDKLDIIAPGADFIYTNASERFYEGLTSAFVVGKAVVNGVHCDHIAFRNPEVDWQIWIQEGSTPLPRKFVVTSKKVPQAPQFEVVMNKWETAPQLNDGVFRFVPPKGARQIEFVQIGTTK